MTVPAPDPARDERIRAWTAAWKRHEEKRDEMFAWARERGQIDECLAGMQRSRSFHEPLSAEDKALLDRIEL